MIRRDTGRSSVVLAVGTTIVGSIPVFLLGALFVQIQDDLDAPAWALGVSVAAYWAAAALVSILSGRIISAIGIRLAAVVSIVVAAASLAGSWLLVPSWQLLALWAIVGGAANGLGHPASNGLLAARVRPARIATAIGIKQGAVPFASFIAGLAVPGIALAVGWPWAFALAVVLTILLLVAFFRWGPQRMPGRRVRGAHERLPAPLLRYLLRVASVTTLGAGAAGAVVSYAVTAGVDRGLGPAAAGILLSAGSLGGAAVRVAAGRIADRTGGRSALPLVAGMLTVGGTGVLLMAVGPDWLFALGVLLALGIGWGWTGLTHYVVSKVAGPATASATGLVQTGSYIGSGGGPLLFGIAFSLVDSPFIWLAVAAAQLVSAAIAFGLVRAAAPPMPTGRAHA